MRSPDDQAGLGVVGLRMKRSEDRRGTWQVPLGLCDNRLYRESIQVVRCDIENLIKLSQRFRETTKTDIGNRVLGEYVNVARVEPLGFVEGITPPLCRFSLVLVRGRDE